MKFHFALILLLLLKLNIPPVYICARPPDQGFSSLLSPNKIQQNYAIGSTFQSNLQQLLAALPPKTTQNNYFYNATHGEAPDQVYGLIMCYADATTGACKSCLAEAPNGILDCCAFNKNGVAWYDDCMIRYSDVAFNATTNIGLMACQPKVLDRKPESLAAEPKKFRAILRKLFDGLATNASTSPRRWAAGKMNYTSTANIHALAQCTRQLLPDDCKMCIANLTDFGVQSCTAVPTDETLMTFSCYARFAMKPFYLISEAHPPWPNSGKRSKEPIPIHILTIIIGGLLALLPNIRL